MFGIGGFELFIILIFGFLIFGPDKLPEIAKTVGKGIARFREAQQEMNETLGGEKIFDPNNPDEPFKDPVEVLDRIAQKQEDKKKGAAATAGATATKTTAAKTAVKPAASTNPANAGATAADAQGESRQESFTERKARYERERAARKAAEAEAVAAGKSGASKPRADDSEGSAPVEKTTEVAAVPEPARAETTTKADVVPEPSVHEGGDA